MTTMPRGREKSSVRKKIRHVRSMPSPIVANMVEKVINKTPQLKSGNSKKHGPCLAARCFL
jgi:hypothetical protein